MTLVDIPTNEFINGFSASLGVRQTIDSRALPNLLAFAKAFHAALGIRLDITEASRSRPRQKYLRELYEAYLARGRRPPWAALAAPLYTSIHDAVKHGNAVDLGSGVATFGTATQQWAAINGPRYGVHPTGLEFSSPEPWHFDIDMITTASSNATPLKDEVPPAPPKPPQEEEEEMPILVSVKDSKGKWAGALVIAPDLKTAVPFSHYESLSQFATVNKIEGAYVDIFEFNNFRAAAGLTPITVA